MEPFNLKPVMRNIPFYSIVFIVLLLLPGCRQGSRSTSGDVRQSEAAVTAANDDFYQEIGQQIGLDFVHSIGDDDLTNIIQSDGGGALSSTLTRMAILIYMHAAGPGLKE